MREQNCGDGDTQDNEQAYVAGIAADGFQLANESKLFLTISSPHKSTRIMQHKCKLLPNVEGKPNVLSGKEPVRITTGRPAADAVPHHHT